jgi:hypothetical protein
MKMLRSLPYLVIFLVNLLVGFLGGSQILPERAGKTYPIIEKADILEDSIPTLANGQRSILLVTVDRFDTRNPRLTGVWAVLYVPTNPRLTLLPIFPALNGGIAGDELAKTFRIRQESGTPKLDQAFTSLIEQQIPWWSGYILLDQTALAEVVNLWVYSPGAIKDSSAVKRSNGSTKEYGKQVISNLPDVWEDPYSALFSQASLFQELCWGMAWAETGIEASQYREHIKLIKDHFSTDLDPQVVLTEIQNLRGLGGSLVCEFPTLSVQARIIK